MNDVNEKDSNEAVTRTKSNKKTRLVLLLLILAAAAGIYMYQRRGLSISGWDSNIDAEIGRAHV